MIFAKISMTFKHLVNVIFTYHSPGDCHFDINLLDSKQIDKTYNDLFFKPVSRNRQPIESFIEKTDIQKASKVRSTEGLLVHIAAAYIFLIFINRSIIKCVYAAYNTGLARK